MPRAVIQNGTIVPLEPLPSEWSDGTEVDVEAVPTQLATDVENDLDELDRLCALGSEPDYQLLQGALRDADREAKDCMRREMGLTE